MPHHAPHHQALEAKITAAIAGDVAGLGYELVRAAVLAGGSFQTLQVMAERADGGPMTVADCTAISRAISEKLDADAAFSDRFTLEVSSPGIDRPLVRLKDYERFKGHVAKVELSAPLEGQKMRKFEGSIVAIDDQKQEIAFQTGTGEVCVPFGSIARAKLVITQALLDEGAKSRRNA